MSAAAILVALIASFGRIPHLASVRVGGNKSCHVQSVIDRVGAVKAKLGFQTSLLDSSRKLQRQHARIFEPNTHNVTDASHTLTSDDDDDDPFALIDQQDASAVQNKTVTGSGGRRYRYVKFLDRGNYGKVWSVSDEEHFPTPIATIEVWRQRKQDFSPRAQEVRLMSRFEGSPYVVQMLDKFQDGNGRYYIVMELAPSLFDLGLSGKWQAAVKEDPNVLTRTFYDLLKGLDFIHKNGVSHLFMNIKSVFIFDGYRAKITDFAYASDTTTPKKRRIGDRPYRSPEMNAGEEYKGPEVDVFALGVILYIMVTSNLPFYDRIWPTKGTKYYPTHEHEEDLREVPEKIKDVIACMLKQRIKCNTTERLQGLCRCDIADLMQMEWIKQAAELYPDN